MSVQKNDDTLFSEYLDSIYTRSHSVGTVHAYKIALNSFRQFSQESYQLEIVDLIENIRAGKLDVYSVLGKFVTWLDKLGKKSSTINLCMASSKGFLWHVDIKIYSEEFKKRVRLPKKRRYREEPLTKEILVRLLRNLPVKLQTATLFAIASGVRIGELVQIRISDIDFKSRPTRVKLRAEITKTREERETFLTEEATTALKDYLCRFFSWREGENNFSIANMIIFGTIRSMQENYQSKSSKTGKEFRCTPVHIAECTILTSLARCVKRIPDLNRLNESGRRMIHFHAFRKYFRTIVGDTVGRDFAEALMGHHFYMDTYYLQTAERKRELYLKAELYLTISENIKIEKNPAKMTEKQRQTEEDYMRFKAIFERSYTEFVNSKQR